MNKAYIVYFILSMMNIILGYLLIYATGFSKIKSKKFKGMILLIFISACIFISLYFVFNIYLDYKMQYKSYGKFMLYLPVFFLFFGVILRAAVYLLFEKGKKRNICPKCGLVVDLKESNYCWKCKINL